jgi:hypothetical protein
LVEGVEKAVGSTIGVRQGDLLGPILFNFHVGRLLEPAGGRYAQ